jgi:hypothetical protein
MKKQLTFTILLSLALLLLAGLVLAGDTITLRLGLTGGGGAVTSAGGLTVISAIGQPFSGAGESPGGDVVLCNGVACGREDITWPAYIFRAMLPLAIKGGS